MPGIESAREQIAGVGQEPEPAGAGRGLRPGLFLRYAPTARQIEPGPPDPGVPGEGDPPVGRVEGRTVVNRALDHLKLDRVALVEPSHLERVAGDPFDERTGEPLRLGADGHGGPRGHHLLGEPLRRRNGRLAHRERGGENGAWRIRHCTRAYHNSL